MIDTFGGGGGAGLALLWQPRIAKLATDAAIQRAMRPGSVPFVISVPLFASNRIDRWKCPLPYASGVPARELLSPIYEAKQQQ